MNKTKFICLGLLLGLSSQAYAKAGIANDGLEFVLAVIGLLLLVAGFLEGTDYLMKNGKGLFNKVKESIRKKIMTLRNLFHKAAFKYSDKQCC